MIRRVSSPTSQITHTNLHSKNRTQPHAREAPARQPLGPSQSEERRRKRPSGGARKDGAPLEPPRLFHPSLHHRGLRPCSRFWPRTSQNCWPPRNTCRRPPGQGPPVELAHLLPPILGTYSFSSGVRWREPPHLCLPPLVEEIRSPFRADTNVVSIANWSPPCSGEQIPTLCRLPTGVRRAVEVHRPQPPTCDCLLR